MYVSWKLLSVLELIVRWLVCTSPIRFRSASACVGSYHVVTCVISCLVCSCDVHCWVVPSVGIGTVLTPHFSPSLVVLSTVPIVGESLWGPGGKCVWHFLGASTWEPRSAFLSILNTFGFTTSLTWFKHYWVQSSMLDPLFYQALIPLTTKTICGVSTRWQWGSSMLDYIGWQ